MRLQVQVTQYAEAPRLSLTLDIGSGLTSDRRQQQKTRRRMIGPGTPKKCTLEVPVGFIRFTWPCGPWQLPFCGTRRDTPPFLDPGGGLRQTLKFPLRFHHIGTLTGATHTWTYAEAERKMRRDYLSVIWSSHVRAHSSIRCP